MSPATEEGGRSLPEGGALTRITVLRRIGEIARVGKGRDQGQSRGQGQGQGHIKDLVIKKDKEEKDVKGVEIRRK